MNDKDEELQRQELQRQLEILRSANPNHNPIMAIRGGRREGMTAISMINASMITSEDDISEDTIVVDDASNYWIEIRDNEARKMADLIIDKSMTDPVTEARDRNREFIRGRYSFTRGRYSSRYGSIQSLSRKQRG